MDIALLTGNFSFELIQDGALFIPIFITTNIVRAIFKPSSPEAKVLGKIFGKLLFLIVLFAAKRSKNTSSYLSYIGEQIKGLSKKVKKDRIIVG